MLPMNKKALTIYTVVIVVSLLVVFWPDTASREISKIKHKTVNIQQWQTKNGVRVLYVYAPELPMLDIQVIFDAGSARDAKKPGLASLANGMLSHGAISGDEVLSIDDISERFENVGARFGAGASKDNAKVSLRSLTDKNWLPGAMDTLQAVINNPTFDENELERVRKQLLVGFERRKQSPASIVNEEFYKAIYQNHPYALPGIGIEQSIKEISRDDLINFHKQFYVVANALVTIVGDVNKEQAQQLAEKIVGQLPPGEKAASIPDVKDLTEAVSLHKEHPSSQTHIMVGQPGLHRKDKDYFVLYVANHILGGSGFGSRIMTEIREKRGLAYSSYSYFAPMLRRGPFTLGMQTSNKHTTQALDVLNETLTTFIKEGPSEKELIHAKRNITGGFPLRIDSNSDISNYLAVIGFYNLPLSYLKDFNQQIEAVTISQIKEAMQRRINPSKMVTVTVGQKQDS